MKRFLIVGAAVVLLAGCDSSDNTQQDPIDNTPPPSTTGANPSPASRDPTPESGRGGDVPSTSPRP
jgi:uncharacterized lipoprotein YajG